MPASRSPVPARVRVPRAAASAKEAAALVCVGFTLLGVGGGSIPAAARVHRVESGASAAAVLSRAAAGDTVLLGAGSFHETIEIKAGVHLRGMGEGRTVLTQPGGEAVRVQSGVRGAGLAHLSVRRSAIGIRVDAADLHIEGCRIEDCDDFGVSARGESRIELANSLLRNHKASALNARSGVQVRIADCQITGNQTGLELDGARAVVVGSEISGNVIGALVRGSGYLELGDRPGAGNRIYRNRLATVRNLTSSPVAARYNYWGDVECAFVRGFTGPVRYLPFMNLALDDSLATCP